MYFEERMKISQVKKWRKRILDRTQYVWRIGGIACV